jgi:hypothetical protein
MEFFNMSRNYKKYRTTVASLEDMVPYLGLFPKDITSLDEVPTILEDGQVNFTKMRGLYKILSPIIQIAHRPKKPIEANHDLQYLLRNPHIIPDAECRELSEQYEPKKKTKDDAGRASPTKSNSKHSLRLSSNKIDDLRRYKPNRRRNSEIEEESSEKPMSESAPAPLQSQPAVLGEILTTTEDPSSSEESDDETSRAKARLPLNPRLSINTDFKISFHPD